MAGKEYIEMQPNLKLLAIEVTKLCNMKCVMCVSHGAGVYEGQAEEQPPFIDFDFFKSIVDQYCELQPEHDRSVVPQFQGEPLVHPKFLQFCEYLERSKTSFSFTTNAQKLTEEIAKELVKMKYLTSVCFSMDGASKEVYEKIRVLGRYDKVLTNIDRFMSLAAEASRKRPTPIETQISYTEQPLNYHETEELLHQWTPKATFVSINNVAVKGRPKEFFFKPAQRIACGDLWYYMVILTDGKAVPCCRDYRYEIPVGNLRERRLRDVWFGPEYTRLRELHLAGRWDEIDVCNDCDTWMCRTPERRTQFVGHTVRVEVGPFFRSAFAGSDCMDSAIIVAPDNTPYEQAAAELQDLASQFAKFFPTYFCVPDGRASVIGGRRIAHNLEELTLPQPFDRNGRPALARFLNSNRKVAPLVWCANPAAARAASQIASPARVLDISASEAVQLERACYDIAIVPPERGEALWSNIAREVHTPESFMRKYGRRSSLPAHDQARWSKRRPVPVAVVTQ